MTTLTESRGPKEGARGPQRGKGRRKKKGRKKKKRRKKRSRSILIVDLSYILRGFSQGK